MTEQLFVRGNAYRIVGIGADGQTCYITGDRATGFVTAAGEVFPVKLNLFGPGMIGEYVTLQHEGG